MSDRSRRIVETAVQLAEEGGFGAVRLRDVAARSGVALGTLYTRFRSKEDILIAALEQETDKLVRLLRLYPPTGETPHARVNHFFSIASRALFMRPNLSRAVLRAVASGDHELAGRIAGFHHLMTRLITAALHRQPAEGQPPVEPTAEEDRLGFLLQQIWFASLVGWMGGLHDDAQVLVQMREATQLVLDGFSAAHGPPDG